MKAGRSAGSLSLPDNIFHIVTILVKEVTEGKDANQEMIHAAAADDGK